MSILHEVQFGQVSAVPLAVVRHRATASQLSRLVPESCGVVWNFARARKLQAGRHVAIYWNGDIQLDVGVEIMDAFDDDEGVVHSATPAGPAAWVVHLGPYGQLGRAHEAIREWCALHNHRLVGPNWEIYGHWESAWNEDPSKIRTDVFYQVASAT